MKWISHRFSPRNVARAWLGVRDSDPADQAFLLDGVSGAALRDRPLYNLRSVIDESLEAWRENPLARRIVALTTQYAVGRGFTFEADHAGTDAFLHEFWNHPLNGMDRRVQEWSDELCRAGNLFVLFSSDVDGMTYARSIPAAQIQEIIPRENDIEQPLRFVTTADEAHLRAPLRVEYPAADALLPELEPAMAHFTVNRPVGAQWGEPDLAPVLHWLRRHATWLEDRARLNHYRSSFLYVVKSQFKSEHERLRRQQALNAMPPAAGSILVVAPDEDWTVISPQLESIEANEDGDALKRMIAAGAGVPMHFLSEPQSESQAGAVAAGGSTYRNYEQRQQALIGIVTQTLRIVASRAALTNRHVDAGAKIHVAGDDISTADNRELSEAGRSAADAALRLYERGLLSGEDAREMTLRFFNQGT